MSANVFVHPERDRMMAARREVLRAMESPEQRRLVELVGLADRMLRGYQWKPSRRGKAKPTLELVSPSGYYLDGSLRCPCEDIRGLKGETCEWHIYSGCT